MTEAKKKKQAWIPMALVAVGLVVLFNACPEYQYRMDYDGKGNVHTVSHGIGGRRVGRTDYEQFPASLLRGGGYSRSFMFFPKRVTSEAPGPGTLSITITRNGLPCAQDTKSGSGPLRIDLTCW
jgi:hypothetical protein